MNKLKYLLIYFIVVLAPTAFCSEFNLNSYISATYSGNRGKYECYETYEYGTISHCSFGTRYNGRMGSLKIFIHYPFEEDTNYRLTFNMATEDFRNNFGSAWTWDCESNTDITNMNSTVWVPTFISYKKAQLSFSLNDNTTCVGVLVRSANYSSDAFTGINNWNLSNITIYDPDWQSGGSGQGTSTPSPSTPDPNQQIIDNANQNTQDIIENNNSNTQQIIDNQNNLLTNKCTNLLDLSNIYENHISSYSLVNDGINLVANSPWQNIIYRIPIENGKKYYFSSLYTTENANSIFMSLAYDKNDIVGTRFYNCEPTSELSGSCSNDFISNRDGYVYLGIWVTKTNTSNNATYLKLMFSEENVSYCPFGSSTSNKIDNINDALTDDTTPTIEFTDVSISSDTPVSDLILMPFTILNKLVDTLDVNTCSSYTIPFDFFGGNRTLTFPCFTIGDYLGSYTGIIDALICLFMIYEIAMMCVSIFDDITSLRDGFGGLYTPKHHDTSTRVGRGEMEGKY